MTVPLYLLDTSVLLLLLRGSDDGRKLDDKHSLTESKQRPLISRVTHGEIRVLASYLDWGKKRQGELRRMLQDFVTIDIHHSEVIDAYVKIDVHSQKHSDGARNMGKNDLWIAACAKAADAILLTTDKDFAHLDEKMLDVEVFVQNEG